jgi:glutamate dehydrogenase/leucine dehydrogenase
LQASSVYSIVAGRDRYRWEVPLMKIVVIGGNGLIGTMLVNRLREKGHEVVAASPNSGVNAITRFEDWLGYMSAQR